MMAMSASDDAVWLHTTCLWNRAGKEDSIHRSNTTNRSSRDYHTWMEILSTSFFRCNIVVASMDAPRVLDLSDSQLFPCGDSNLLLLRNLQSANINKGMMTYQVLLSDCFMIPPSSGDASRMYVSNDDGNHNCKMNGWQVDVSPSTFYWADQQAFHQEVVTFNLTNAFETFRSTHSSGKPEPTDTLEPQLRTNKTVPVAEQYGQRASDPTLQGMCWKSDMQPKHAASDDLREAWEALLKQSIENELHQIDFGLVFLGAIAFVLSLFFIWEVSRFYHKNRKSLNLSSWFTISRVPSSIAPLSSTPSCNKPAGVEPTSIDGVVAAATLDISPLSLDPIFASSQVDRLREQQVNPEEAPEETLFRIKRQLQPNNRKRFLRPAIISPEREQYFPTSCSSSTPQQPPRFLSHGEQQRRQQQEQEQQSQPTTIPVAQTVLAKCFRPSEGRFVMRPIPITPRPPSASHIEPSSRSISHPGSTVDLHRAPNHEARSTLTRGGLGRDVAPGTSFVHDYWCD